MGALGIKKSRVRRWALFSLLAVPTTEQATADGAAGEFSKASHPAQLSSEVNA